MSSVMLSRVQQMTVRQEKKQKRKAEEEKLHVKKREVDKAKITDGVQQCSLFTQPNGTVQVLSLHQERVIQSTEFR